MRADSTATSSNTHLQKSRAPCAWLVGAQSRGEPGSRWGSRYRGVLQGSGLKRGSGPSPAVHDDYFYAPCTNPSLTCKESDSC